VGHPAGRGPAPPYGIRRGARGWRGQRAASGWQALTPTEIKIAALVARGDSTSDIARGMSLPRGTVQTYISRIFTKLGAKGRVEIVREALRHGVSPCQRASTAAAAGRVSSHDHYSQPDPADSVDMCPAPGTGQAAARNMHRMTQPGLVWASVPATAYYVSDVAWGHAT
jgi:DNA-binding CsgD family transcriptional regulator